MFADWNEWFCYIATKTSAYYVATDATRNPGCPASLADAATQRTQNSLVQQNGDGPSWQHATPLLRLLRGIRLCQIPYTSSKVTTIPHIVSNTVDKVQKRSLLFTAQLKN